MDDLSFEASRAVHYIESLDRHLRRAVESSDAKQLDNLEKQIKDLEYKMSQKELELKDLRLKFASQALELGRMIGLISPFDGDNPTLKRLSDLS